MKPFVFSTTKSIISEIGAVERIADICLTLGISKPLIITDQGIVYMKNNSEFDNNNVNGVDIAYQLHGNPSHPTLLLIHGLSTPLTGWLVVKPQ